MPHKHYQTGVTLVLLPMHPGGLRLYMHRGNYKISGSESFLSKVEWEKCSN